MPTEYISRPYYEAQLRDQRDTPDIKVITGVRRCGKSSLMHAFAQQVAAGVGDNNVLYLRMDAFGVPLNPTAEWLQEQVTEAWAHSNRQLRFYVFLDEVQEVPHWEKVVRRLHTEENIDVYLTGSNAHVLSSDLATLLGGRYHTIRVSPLSFVEYERFERERADASQPGARSGVVLDAAARSGVPLNDATDAVMNRVDLAAASAQSNSAASADPSDFAARQTDACFARYVRYGGMPAQFDMPDRSERRLADMLRAVYETVILNDVAPHVRISDMDLLEKLTRYVFSTSGTLFSARGITNALAASGRKTSVETVENYLHALQDAYIVADCEQVGIAGKQMLRPQRKFYPVDTGLRNLMTGFSPSDFGAQLECVVFNELVRRSYTVRVGTLRVGEIDFVAQRGSEQSYIQVCESFGSQETYERELAPFARLGDSFPCMVLTLDPHRLGTTEQGVRIVNLIDWLRGGGDA